MILLLDAAPKNADSKKEEVNADHQLKKLASTSEDVMASEFADHPPSKLIWPNAKSMELKGIVMLPVFALLDKLFF